MAESGTITGMDSPRRREACLPHQRVELASLNRRDPEDEAALTSARPKTISRHAVHRLRMRDVDQLGIERNTGAARPATVTKTCAAVDLGRRSLAFCAPWLHP